MKFSSVFSAAASVALLCPVPGLAHPRMAETLAEVQLQARGAASKSSSELIGDLANTPWWKLSTTGLQIRTLLTGYGNPESDARYWNVPGLKDRRCRTDTCCVWKYIADDMEKFFRAADGTCNAAARKAVRLGFHDAGTWSRQTAGPNVPSGGGADGSIILSEELGRFANRGLAEMGGQYRIWYDLYHNQLGFQSVTYADLLQLGANVATVVCPLGPRTRTYVGRKDSAVANPDGLLPSPFDTAANLIQLFRDKTIEPHGLVALLGAHTTSTQSFVNASQAGAPQDSTPGVWDVKYYSETSGTAAKPPNVFSFQSDINLANDPVTSGDFRLFSGRLGQAIWNKDYAREYIRLSLLGVNNINKLTECTKVLPVKRR